MKHFLGKDERVEADDGYVGEEPEFCKTPGGFSSRAENMQEQRKRLRSRHETVNMRLKNFAVLNQRYRHNLEDHAYIFRAVAVLVQISLENGEPLFEL